MIFESAWCATRPAGARRRSQTPGRQADRRQHGVRLPLAAHSAPAVRRRLSPRSPPTWPTASPGTSPASAPSDAPPARLPLPARARRAHHPPARRPAPRRGEPSDVRRARGARAPAPAGTTPHTLRRTYISIALLANGFDVKWVMSQVGHADSKMTLDVYAQLEQRADRTHGTSFDALIQRAEDARSDAELVMKRSRRLREPKQRSERPSRRRTQEPATAGKSGTWRDPDSNRGHHDFQATVSDGAQDGMPCIAEFRRRARRSTLASPQFAGVGVVIG